VMNLPRYNTMWSERFSNIMVQNRWVDSVGHQTAPNKPEKISTILKGDGKIDEDKVHKKIRKQQELAIQDEKNVRGLYVQGDCAPYKTKTEGDTKEAAENGAKQIRKNLMKQRGEKRIVYNKKEKGMGWQDAPDATPSKSVCKASGEKAVDLSTNKSR